MADGDCKAIIDNNLSATLSGMSQTHATVVGIMNLGAANIAEAARLDYLRNKGTIDFAQGTGQRMVTESGSSRTREEVNAPPP
jgi:hypothetical protein